MNIVLWDLIGAVGLAMILIAFYLEHKKGFSKQHSYAYNGLNLCGSLVLLAYAVQLNSVIFIALNIAWAGIAIYFILKRLKKESLTKNYSPALEELNDDGGTKSLGDLK